jgi:imidazolonepropionase-like amidohydrolase
MPTAIGPTTAAVDAHMLPSLVDLAHYNREQGTLSMRAAASAGVRIGLGSDAETLDGDGTALELVRMVHHGLSPVEALRAATSVAAEAIGLQDNIGAVQPGKLADLVVLDGDAKAEPELLSIKIASGSCCSSERPLPVPPKVRNPSSKSVRGR